jgi:energy-coupling factor transporter transmembrane protein EcfT
LEAGSGAPGHHIAEDPVPSEPTLDRGARILRYKADRRPVVWVFTMFALHGLVFFAASPGIAFLRMKLPLWAFLGLAIYWNPVNAFLAILLPGFLTLAHTAWATYEHHAGHYPTDHYDASVSIVNPL